MSGPSLLHAQLVEQARQLARKEPRRPLASSLRRAVSTAWLALHHFLVREAARGLVGSAREREPLRELLARSCRARVLAETCRAFSAPRLEPALAHAAGAADVPRDLRRVAWAYLTLRHHRLRADYDPSVDFGRAEALVLVSLAEEAMRSWRRVRHHDAARVFLLCLLVGVRE